MQSVCGRPEGSGGTCGSLDGCPAAVAGALASGAMGIENPVHLLFIAVVALVVLGPRRLPDLAKALGHGIREFRDAMSSGEQDGPEPPPAATTAPVPPVAPAQTQSAPPAQAEASTAHAPEQSAG